MKLALIHSTVINIIITHVVFLVEILEVENLNWAQPVQSFKYYSEAVEVPPPPFPRAPHLVY